MVRAGPPPLEEEPRRRAGHDRERARRRPARVAEGLRLAAAPVRVVPREQDLVGVERSLRIALQELASVAGLQLIQGMWLYFLGLYACVCEFLACCWHLSGSLEAPVSYHVRALANQVLREKPVRSTPDA